MKRALLLPGLLGVFVAPSLRAQTQDTVSVGVGGELSALAGDSLRVPVFADLTTAGGRLLGSYTLRITWNPSVLYYRGVIDGAFSTPLVRSDSTGYGVLYASAISATGLGGRFNLFDLALTPYDTLADTVRVQVKEMSAASTFMDLLASATVLTRSAPYCAARGRWGDVDKDGFANSRDALAILASLVGLATPPGFEPNLGDVDGDGLANSRDALILLSYAVGLAIPGQRVLLTAPGTCTGGTPQLTALPDTVDLVIGQSVTVKAFGRDASGQPLSLASLQWATANPTIAAVDQSGSVTGRSAGTTTLTAGIGPGVQVDVPVVIRASRGTWYVDAQRAKLASVQMGTQKWPFATPEYAFPVVSEGDTIRIAPGIVDYEFGGGCGVECYPLGASDMAVGVVVIGDTLADGTRPVLRGDGSTSALEWGGGRHAELHNLVLRGFYYGVYLNGVSTFLAQNVEFRDTLSSYGYGLYAHGYVDTLRVLDSHFASDTVSYGYGVYVTSGAGLVELRNVTADYLYYPVYAHNVDSLDVAQSQFSHSYDQAIYASNASPSTLGARISQNRFVGGRYAAAVYLSGVRHVATDHNYFSVVANDGLDIYGPSSTIIQSGTRVSMLGDSIQFRPAYDSWADIEDVDSVLVDSLWVGNRLDSAMYQYGYLYANYARVTSSQLLGVYGQGLQFNGRQLVVDRTLITGCDTCTWNSSSYGIRAYAGNDSGPRLRITNSSFRRLAYGVYSPSSNTAAGPMVISGNTFESLATALNLYGDSLAITGNQFTNVRDYSVLTRPGYTAGHPFIAAQMLGNRVTCAVVGYYSYGLYNYDGPARFEGNNVQNCRYGLSAYNYSSYGTAAVGFRADTVTPDSASYDRTGILVTGKWQPTLVANRITGGYYGISLATSDATVNAQVDSNVVTGTSYAALYLSAVPGPLSGSYNNFKNNTQFGVYDASSAPSHGLTLGRFVGNGRPSVYSFGTFAFDATQNWWGVGTGANSGADSTSGNVTATPYLTTDPEGATVPAAPSIAGVIAAGPAPTTSATAPLGAAPLEPQAPAARGMGTGAEGPAAHGTRRALLEAANARQGQAAREATERRAPRGARAVPAQRR